MQNGGMMSSLKFSYWSSPHTSTKSGLKSSRILRIARKSLPNRSPQRLAAPSPSSLPSSANNSFGQLAGSLTLGSTLGAPSTRWKTPVSVSFLPHRVGQWVQPSPRISAMFLFLLSKSSLIVIPGLDPGIHVDGRVKPGHDGKRGLHVTR